MDRRPGVIRKSAGSPGKRIAGSRKMSDEDEVHTSTISTYRLATNLDRHSQLGTFIVHAQRP